MQDVTSLQTSRALDLVAGQKLKAAEQAPQGESRAAAKRFEALLATQLVKEMRRTLDDGFFGSGPGSEVFDGWLDEHLGEALVRGRGLGLTEGIAASLGEKFEAAQAAAAKAAAGEAQP
ncbi:MAG: rod-binding protein [Planctomycetes bacterium]|nr:rod-binding protein [Planctomycetota bacterium]